MTLTPRAPWSRKQFGVGLQACSTSGHLVGLTRGRLAGVGHTVEVTPTVDRATGERHNVTGRTFIGCQLVGAQGMTRDCGELYPLVALDDWGRLVRCADGMESAGV